MEHPFVITSKGKLQRMIWIVYLDSNFISINDRGFSGAPGFNNI